MGMGTEDTDKTAGYETLQSMECLILLSKASDHVVYPTVLAVPAKMGGPGRVLFVGERKALPRSGWVGLLRRWAGV